MRIHLAAERGLNAHDFREIGTLPSARPEHESFKQRKGRFPERPTTALAAFSKKHVFALNSVADITAQII
jgi:hypothetical protein